MATHIHLSVSPISLLPIYKQTIYTLSAVLFFLSFFLAPSALPPFPFFAPKLPSNYHITLNLPNYQVIIKLP